MFGASQSKRFSAPRATPGPGAYENNANSVSDTKTKIGGKFATANRAVTVPADGKPPLCVPQQQQPENSGSTLGESDVSRLRRHLRAAHTQLEEQRAHLKADQHQRNLLLEQARDLEAS